MTEILIENKISSLYLPVITFSLLLICTEQNDCAPNKFNSSCLPFERFHCCFFLFLLLFIYYYTLAILLHFDTFYMTRLVMINRVTTTLSNETLPLAPSMNDLNKLSRINEDGTAVGSAQCSPTQRRIQLKLDWNLNLHGCHSGQIFL